VFGAVGIPVGGDLQDGSEIYRAINNGDDIYAMAVAVVWGYCVGI